MSKHVRFPSGSFHHSWQFSLVLLTTAMVQQGIYMQKETITWWLVLNSNYKSESTKEKKIAGAMADTPTPWSSTRWNWSLPRTKRQSCSGDAPRCLRWLLVWSLSKWTAAQNSGKTGIAKFRYDWTNIFVFFFFYQKREDWSKKKNLCCEETVIYR